MIRVAIPNKGALNEDSMAIISAAGYKIKRGERELCVTDAANNIEFLFLRPRDIATYTANGIVSIGITGRDLLFDSQASAVEIMPLGFGKSKFYYAVPNDSHITQDSLDGKRIATSYPNIVKADLAKRGMNASIVKLDGAVEISIRLGVADVIADVTETGSTMKNAGLHPEGDPIMESEAIVIGKDKAVLDIPEVKTFLRRIEGIIVAKNYLIVEYDVKQENLEAVCALTPGFESPTVAPLNKPGWFAVKSMINRKEVNQIIDKLEELGANGIIVSNIITCRI